MAAFAGLGVTASFVPAVLPAAGRATAGDLDAAVPALFGGLLAGVLASGPLLRAVPAARVLQAGGALQALAVVVAACAADAAPFVAAAVLAGVGFGLVEAAGRGSAPGRCCPCSPSPWRCRSTWAWRRCCPAGPP